MTVPKYMIRSEPPNGYKPIGWLRDDTDVYRLYEPTQPLCPECENMLVQYDVRNEDGDEQQYYCDVCCEEFLACELETGEIAVPSSSEEYDNETSDVRQRKYLEKRYSLGLEYCRKHGIADFWQGGI